VTHTARYGASVIHGGDTLYGEPGLVYGAAAVDRRLTWVLLIDWDADGVFGGENDARHIFSMESENGRQFYMRGDASGPEPVQPGKVTLGLRNHDGQYDPYNQFGPLYGLILPGVRFELSVQVEATATREPIMTGFVEDVRPVYGEADMVKMTLVNELADFKGSEIRTEVQTNIRFDDAVQACLDAFGWTGPVSIDTTVSETMAYWWASGLNVFSEIQSVVDAALGLFCIAEDGTATYKSRVSGDAPLLTLTGADIQQEYGIRTPSPWDVVKNDIRVYARARLPLLATELWRSNDAMLILPGETLSDIWASFSVNGEEAVATAIIAPVITTDFTFNAAADGSGADLSADMVITINPSDVFATALKMSITNTGGTAAYRTLLKVRGDAIVADKYSFVEGVDQVSIDRYRRRKFKVQSEWLQDFNTATSQKDLLLSRLAQARQFPRFKIEGKPDKQFPMRLFGLVTVNFVSKGITGEFRVGYVKHRWMDETGESVESEFYLEPNLLGNTEGTWIFPAVFGETTVF
jgi:hypothetical protein